MAKGLRICSFLASGTEIVYALGLSVIGRSECCDYPPDALSAPIVIRSSIASGTMSGPEIDSAIRESVRNGISLYSIDMDMLERLRPELIITQGLCKVCSIHESDVIEELDKLSWRPSIVSLSPSQLEDIFHDILKVGRAIEREDRALELVSSLRDRVSRVSSMLKNSSDKPRVVCLEWIEPPIAAGHWTPELVKLAGGEPSLVGPGEAARRISWRDVADYDPDVLILAPCGFSTNRALQEAKVLGSIKELKGVRAVKEGRVYAVDAKSYISRHGPRVIDGLELLAHIIHPELFKLRLKGAYERLYLG